MIRNTGWSTLLIVVLALGSGCGAPGAFGGGGEEDPNGPPPPPPPPKGHDRVFRLDDPLDYSLKDLLAKSRRELAALGEEWLEKVRIQQQKLRTGELAFHLMPELRLPLVIPGFRQAKYSARRDMVLPPYLEESKKDNAVALHLARFGDVDGALRLAADPAVEKLIKVSRGAANYPVEWTRLVALQLQVAQVRLAVGEPEGARQLIGLHQQLKEILDPRTQKGQLGALLLSRGHSVLAAAARAWRQESQADPTKLADQADAALGAWGPNPAVRPLIPWGSDRAEVARLLDSPASGYVVGAHHPERAFDLLALPFPDAEAEGVLAGFDAAGRFVDLLVIYRARGSEDYSRPAQLAQVLEESGVAGTDLPPLPGLIQRSYPLGGKSTTATVTLTPTYSEVGALIQFRRATGPGQAPPLARRFGDVDFDDSFDANRVRLALNKNGLSVRAVMPKNLGPLAALPQVVPGDHAVLERSQAANVVTRLTLHFVDDPQGLLVLTPLVLPLESLGGPARVSGGEGEDGRFLSFSWSDGSTRFTLRVPQQRDRAPDLDVADLTPPAKQADRARQAAAKDLAERAARFKEGKLQQRIPRTWEQIRLGMTRAELKEALPNGKGIKQRALPDGIGIIFREVPEDHPGYLPRELFVRLGPDQRVAEVRVRYTNAPEGQGLDRLLAEIVKAAGAPLQLPGSWAQVWKGFPQRPPAPILYRWQDDVSLLTCQRDSEGLELAVRDRPLENPDGLPLAAFRCVPAGPSNCRLGESREVLLARWKNTEPEFQKDVLLLRPQGGLYDVLMVSFADGRAVRILARHRRQYPNHPGREALAKDVRDAWAESLLDFGFPRREDTNSRREMQMWTTHDEVTRVSLFWQENKEGTPRLVTEWVGVEGR